MSCSSETRRCANCSARSRASWTAFFPDTRRAISPHSPTRAARSIGSITRHSRVRMRASWSRRQTRVRSEETSCGRRGTCPIAISRSRFAGQRTQRTSVSGGPATLAHAQVLTTTLPPDAVASFTADGSKRTSLTTALVLNVGLHHPAASKQSCDNWMNETSAAVERLVAAFPNDTRVFWVEMQTLPPFNSRKFLTNNVTCPPDERRVRLNRLGIIKRGRAALVSTHDLLVAHPKFSNAKDLHFQHANRFRADILLNHLAGGSACFAKRKQRASSRCAAARALTRSNQPWLRPAQGPCPRP